MHTGDRTAMHRQANTNIYWGYRSMHTQDLVGEAVVEVLPVELLLDEAYTVTEVRHCCSKLIKQQR
jgi:hypothetical protein